MKHRADDGSLLLAEAGNFVEHCDWAETAAHVDIQKVEALAPSVPWDRAAQGFVMMAPAESVARQGRYRTRLRKA